jgi:hypothetical protein
VALLKMTGLPEAPPLALAEALPPTIRALGEKLIDPMD